MESEAEGREGVLGSRVGRGGGVRRESEAAYGDAKFERTGSLWRFFPTVRATAAAESGSGNEKALAGDPK